MGKPPQNAPLGIDALPLRALATLGLYAPGHQCRADTAEFSRIKSRISPTVSAEEAIFLRFPSESFHLYNAGRLPRAFAHRQDGRRLGLRPVEAHHQIDRTVGSGKPVGLLVRAGGFVLDIEGQ